MGTSAIVLAVSWWFQPYEKVQKKMPWLFYAEMLLVMLEAWCLSMVALIDLFANTVEKHNPVQPFAAPGIRLVSA